MGLRQVQKNWFGSAVGRFMNPDRMYQFQCVDVVDDYAEAIFPGKRWQDTVGGVNGANGLLRAVNPAYWQVFHNDPKNPKQLPEPGDVLVYGGSPVNEWGHTAVCYGRVTVNGSLVVQQNSNGLANLAAHLGTLPWYGVGTGALIGWARPRPERMPADPPPASRSKLVAVSVPVAVVRTSPRVEAGNVARAYPTGIAKGARVAAVGYVKGTDPYPNDGRTDDAWVKTVSGYYIWANSVGNNLTGLPKL